jgi:hypothetical protein
MQQNQRREFGLRQVLSERGVPAGVRSRLPSVRTAHTDLKSSFKPSKTVQTRQAEKTHQTYQAKNDSNTH